MCALAMIFAAVVLPGMQLLLLGAQLYCMTSPTQDCIVKDFQKLLGELDQNTKAINNLGNTFETIFNNKEDKIKPILDATKKLIENDIAIFKAQLCSIAKNCEEFLENVKNILETHKKATNLFSESKFQDNLEESICLCQDSLQIIKEVVIEAVEK